MKNPTIMSNIPDLHKQAFMFKNKKRLQHDGGRAWIKDSQLHEARKDGNFKMETIQKKKDVSKVDKFRDHNPSI